MTRLSVNVNKVATLRNARDGSSPGVARAATIALDAGAHGITVHPRPDERHIRADDVQELAAVVAARAGAEYNIEGNPFDGVLDHLERIGPTQATLVPDAATQTTSDHGWDLPRDGAAPRAHRSAASRSRRAREPLVDADTSAVAIAADLGADRVALYTEPHARSHARGTDRETLRAFVAAATEAHRRGLGVNAGHDLSLANLGDFLATVPGVLEVSIGHALVADAFEFGLAAAVARYLAMVSPR